MDKRKGIGRDELRELQPGKIAWDPVVPGLGARRQRDAITYFLKYRTADGRQRWHTIGRNGSPWTPDAARKEARRLLGDIDKGGDPSGDRQARRNAVDMGELCDRYLADAKAGRVLIRGGRTKKQRTLSGDHGMIDGHIKPLLGRLAVAAVTRADVERFMYDVAAGETATKPTRTKPHGVSKLRGGRGVATRTMGLLGAIFGYAIERGLRSDNPVRGVRRYADNRRERRLSDAEYAAFGTGLRQAEATIWPAAVAAARFMALTGWRRGEVLGLRWADVDLAERTAVLPDSKTGRSLRLLSHAACELLRGLPPIGERTLAFPPTRGAGLMAGFPKFWGHICELGGLPADVTPHVLRHSFASLAADLGYSEPTIAALIGHKGLTITSRYIRSADAVLLAAADAVAERVSELIGEAEAHASVAELRRA